MEEQRLQMKALILSVLSCFFIFGLMQVKLWMVTLMTLGFRFIIGLRMRENVATEGNQEYRVTNQDD